MSWSGIAHRLCCDFLVQLGVFTDSPQRSMTPEQEQTIYLGAVFTAALQADQLARTGKMDEATMECLLKSLLVVDPPNALHVYGGEDYLLMGGYRLLAKLLRGDADTPQEPVRYALTLLMLERKLYARSEMMQTIGERLGLIQTKVDHFGIMSENVIAACAQLYQDTVSQCGKRIMIVGEPLILQRQGVPEKLRAILLTGIRAAMQWQYMGGRRWRFFFSRKKLLQPVLQRLGQTS